MLRVTYSRGIIGRRVLKANSQDRHVRARDARKPRGVAGKEQVPGHRHQCYDRAATKGARAPAGDEVVADVQDGVEVSDHGHHDEEAAYVIGVG